MKYGLKRFLIGSGISMGVAAVTGAVSYAITRKLVSVALDRPAPKAYVKAKETLARTDEMRSTRALIDRAAITLQESAHTLVEITARDGIKLVGHLRMCENPKRVLIAMHGWRSSCWNDFGVIADFWYHNNCAVLYAEQRGQGESGGSYMGFGMLERFDCLDWIGWLNANGFESMPMYLAGVSMGASTVLMTGGLSLPENIRGIIADCGFTSPHAIWKHVTENNLRLLYSGIRSAIVDDICKKKIQLDSNDGSCTEALKRCTVPVLFIHGTDDKLVPITMTYENYKACAAPKRLLVVPGAEHGMSYLVDRVGYEAAVKQFWDACDAPGDARRRDE